MLSPQSGLRRTRAAELNLVREAFAQSVIRGLSDRPRWLNCRYLYDARGSAIFERITEQPEYYPTRSEAEILSQHAARIRALCGSSTLAELGAGSASKTRHLLRAWTEGNQPAQFVAVDISASMLSETCAALRNEFPTLTVHKLAGSYEQALPALKDFSPLTLLFLGSSIGNFNKEELGEFFTLLSANMADGDRFLLGIDLVKDTATLEAAYNDAAGWSAAFSLNLFARMNRELGTSVNLEDIDYVARWNEERSHIEMFARFRRDAVVSLPDWNRQFHIKADEMVLVEISRKFRSQAMAATAFEHGFDHIETLTDSDQRFALLLFERGSSRTTREETLRNELFGQLQTQRERTLEMVRPLTDEQRSVQHSRILSPVVWDLGHIASFEREWIDRADGAAERPGNASPANASLYDPVLHPRPIRGTLPLPNSETCLNELAAVRSDTATLLNSTRFPVNDPLLGTGFVFSMVAQHEAQHSETILQGLQLLPSLGYEPAHRPARPHIAERTPKTRDASATPTSSSAFSRITAGDLIGSEDDQEKEPENSFVAHVSGEAFIPSGLSLMGTDDTATAYDNERPAHHVELDSFWIDVAPVSNATFAHFIEDGGYLRRELWTNDGWKWLRESKVESPAQWTRNTEGQWTERAFGRVEALQLDQPVVHVCWHEASACARWLGKRLPTEAEWEKAAAWDLERGLPRRYPWGDSPPDQHRANLDQRTFAPSALGTLPRGSSYFGCHHMLGDVWEWTSSDFLPYPGFRAFPYPEYSRIHFGSRHKVLRGGSWATPSIAIRNTFRNWDLPERRQIFAGLRCARD